MKKIVFGILLILSNGIWASDFAHTKKLAESGDINAQFDLATLYDVGEGIKRDLQQAAIWYRKAAEQGEVAAQYNLAIMYDTGEGVGKDIVQAYAWMAAAEMFGYQGGKETSQRFYQRMSKEEQDKGELLVMDIVNHITERHHQASDTPTKH